MLKQDLIEKMQYCLDHHCGVEIEVTVEGQEDTEIIVNTASSVENKLDYYLKAYEEKNGRLVHKHNNNVEIVAINAIPEIDESIGLSFGEALEQVKIGHGMRLSHWSPDVVVRAMYPDESEEMTAPYLYVESRYGKVPWKETMIELFSEEWTVVE